MAAFEVIEGGAPTVEEVAAIAAALEVVLGGRPEMTRPVSPWRWSGRWWREGGASRPNWRQSRSLAHPLRP